MQNHSFDHRTIYEESEVHFIYDVNESNFLKKINIRINRYWKRSNHNILRITRRDVDSFMFFYILLVSNFFRADINCLILIDILDLLLLQAHEAAECLDDFLDIQIIQLWKVWSGTKTQKISTGRGINIRNGFSIIKTKTIQRLRERHLT